MRKYYKYVFLGSIGLGVNFSCKSEVRYKPFIQTVKVYTVNQKTDRKVSNITGEIKEKKKVNLAFRVAGPMRKFPAEIGLHVKEGDLLAEIDPRDYQLKHDAIKAEYDQIQADVERVKKLYNTNSVAKSEYDRAIAGSKGMDVKFRAAKNSLRDTQLRAPFDGYVQDKFFENYETVNAGMPVVSIIDINTLIVETTISAALYLKKNEFSAYSCTPVDMPSAKFKLKLIESSKKSNSNQLYKLRFELENTEAKKLFPGMNVNIQITRKTKKDRIVSIPQSSIFHKAGKDYVWLIRQGKVKARQVNLESLVSKRSMVLVSGLEDNMTIVSAGVHALKEGQKVKILKKPSKSNVGGLL